MCVDRLISETTHLLSLEQNYGKIFKVFSLFSTNSRRKKQCGPGQVDGISTASLEKRLNSAKSKSGQSLHRHFSDCNIFIGK